MHTKLLLPFLALLFSFSAHARWAELKDADYAVNFERSVTKVRKDGSYLVTVERQVEVLKESARERQGLFRMSYDAHASTFKVLAAKTINKDKTILVDKSDIEVKPTASTGPGFDVNNQVTIAFPDVTVGSKLYLKFVRNVQKPSVPGLYYSHFPLGWNEYLQTLEIKIESEAPLYHEVHDPDKKLLIQSAARSLSIQLKEPLFKMALEEENPLMDPSTLTWISLSTAKTWADIPRKTVMKYEDTMASALPKKFDAILKKAAEKKTDVERINAVTSTLADTVRYVGDWRPIEGAYHPRALAKIADTGYGDCKDFTVSTSAILRRLGFETHAAWIARGKDWVVTPLTSVASPDTNHAIVYAKKDGREYWIDPTNSTSYAQGIYNDIANRPALVLLPDGSQLKRTPPMLESHGELSLRGVVDIDPATNIVKAKGNFKIDGLTVLPMTGTELSFTKQYLDYTLMGWITTTANLISWQLGTYSLSSRVVQALDTTYDYQETWRPILTSMGQGYLVPAPQHANYFKARRDKRVTSIKMDDPVRWERELKFTGRKAKLTKELACSGESAWADFSRRMTADGSGAVILKDQIRLKGPSVPLAAVQTAEFGDFQTKILSCMQDAVVVFE